jgi:ABC-type dipeptide/oligopeptide/nickel transport system ATPase component
MRQLFAIRASQAKGLRGWDGQKIPFSFPIVAIVGENGSGKSTVLQCAASVYRPPGRTGSRAIWRTLPDRTGSRLFGGTGLELDIAFDADFGDQTELSLGEIHAILFRLEDLTEQVSRYKIADSFAMRDPLAQDR